MGGLHYNPINHQFMKIVLLLKFFVFIVVPSILAQNDRTLSPEEMLNIGRELMKQERWEEARRQFGAINQHRKGLGGLVRAEGNFSYGLCLEKLGKTDDAIKVYNAVIAVYGSHVTWASQALERGFNLSYQANEPEKKIEAYSYLRKILYMLQNFQEANDPSGALGRMRKRLPEVVKELGLTPGKLAEIDHKLEITQK